MLKSMLIRRFSSAIPEHAKTVMAKGLPKKRPIPGVDNVLLVSSAKGGVGKSTVAVNLAIALSKINASKTVGILDSDVFGPSIPQLMGISEIRPSTNDQNYIIPIQNFGIKCMSMGSLIGKNSAVVWRGLMVMQAINTLLRQVIWGPLSTLIVDTPPGTGDVHLSLSQSIPIKGSVVVTTSHSLSLSDTQRGIEMLRKLNIPIVGLVENMAQFVCPSCNSSTDLWPSVGTNGENGVTVLSKHYNLPVLSRIPLEPRVSACCEEGAPAILFHPNSRTAEAFMVLATHIDNVLNAA